MKRFRGLRGQQKKVFEKIARGDIAQHNPRTLEALANRQLIKYRTHVIPVPGLGLITLDLPYVPEDIHQFWCQWCVDHRRKWGVLVGNA